MKKQDRTLIITNKYIRNAELKLQGKFWTGYKETETRKGKISDINIVIFSKKSSEFAFCVKGD